MRKLSSDGRRRLAAICLAACLVFGCASGEVKMEMTADEWSWEEGDASFFHGSIRTDEPIEEVTLRLSVKTRLKESGTIQFTSLKGKKLKTKQRSETVTADLGTDAPTEFMGQWFLPEELDTELAYAAISLQALDRNGKEIASGTLEVGSRNAEDAAIENSPVATAERVIKTLALLAAALWLMAVARHLTLNRKTTGKE